MYAHCSSIGIIIHFKPYLVNLPREGKGEYFSRCLWALLPEDTLEILEIHPQGDGDFMLTLNLYEARIIKLERVWRALEDQNAGFGSFVLYRVMCALRVPVWDSWEIWDCFQDAYESRWEEHGDEEAGPITREALLAEIGERFTTYSAAKAPWHVHDLPSEVELARPLRPWLLHLESLLECLKSRDESAWTHGDGNPPPVLIFDYGGAGTALQLYQEMRDEDMFNSEYTPTHLYPTPQTLPRALNELHLEEAVLDAVVEHLECQDPHAPHFPALGEISYPNAEDMHEITLEELRDYWTRGTAQKPKKPAREKVLSCIAALTALGDTPYPSPQALLF